MLKGENIYVQDADFTLLNCDVLDGLRSLEAGSVHCVVSPPYDLLALAKQGEAYDAALNRLNSMYRGEPEEPSTEELAETVQHVCPRIEDGRLLAAESGSFKAVSDALSALSELVIRAQADLAAAEKERDYKLSVQSADEWLHHRFNEVCDERDKLAAAHEEAIRKIVHARGLLLSGNHISAERTLYEALGEEWPASVFDQQKARESAGL